MLQSQVESVFREYDVALVLTAHEHNYQRTYPVYQQKVVNTSYDNPSAPTYLVTPPHTTHTHTYTLSSG